MQPDQKGDDLVQHADNHRHEPAKQQQRAKQQGPTLPLGQGGRHACRQPQAAGCQCAEHGHPPQELNRIQLGAPAQALQVQGNERKSRRYQDHPDGEHRGQALPADQFGARPQHDHQQGGDGKTTTEPARVVGRLLEHGHGHKTYGSQHGATPGHKAPSQMHIGHLGQWKLQ